MIKKLFYEIDMNWKRVIIFAIAVAIYSAVVLNVPILLHSSLGHTGETFEAWIFFALIIILNCKKPLDASLKTFVFFLISQPLIYLLQVPFSYLGWQIFMFYPRWFYLTLLTLPGAYIAWYVKKDNILSSLILSVATSFLMSQGCYFIPSLINDFPKNLLTVVFCLGLAYSLIFIVLKNKRNKIISLVITSLALVASLLYFVF